MKNNECQIYLFTVDDTRMAVYAINDADAWEKLLLHISKHIAKFLLSDSMDIVQEDVISLTEIPNDQTPVVSWTF